VWKGKTEKLCHTAAGKIRSQFEIMDEKKWGHANVRSYVDTMWVLRVVCFLGWG